MPRAIMDISAPAISLAVRPQWAIWVTSVRLRPALRSRGLNLGCLEYATMSEDAPSNASELIGERDSEDVVM